jgi:predicted secreted hydrolase
MNKQRVFTLFILFFVIVQMITVSNISSNPFIYEKSEESYNPPLDIITHQSKLINKLSFFQSFLFPSTLRLDPSRSFFKPENLSNSDDAYHETNQSYEIEWWYFDATLNQQYTFQFSIHLYSILSAGFVTTQCNIYEKGKIVISESTFYSLTNTQLSTEKPIIKINDELVMNILSPSIEESGTYQIRHSGSNYSFNLIFQGITKGWKGTTDAGDWAVILPKAITSGTLTIQNTTKSVQGIGYHDHNWNVSVSTGINFGWLWGKTVSDHHALTWANIFKTWYKQIPLLVINKDNDGYINIPAEQIECSVTKIEFKNGMIIPYGFIVTARSQQYDITLSVEITDSDYSTVLGLINYWRYHIHTTGELKIDGQSELINDYNIAEFMRFRPY